MLGKGRGVSREKSSSSGLPANASGQVAPPLSLGLPICQTGTAKKIDSESQGCGMAAEALKNKKEERGLRGKKDKKREFNTVPDKHVPVN